MDLQQQEQPIYSQTHAPLPGGSGSGGIVHGTKAALGEQTFQDQLNPTVIAASTPQVLNGFGGAGPGMNAHIMGQLMTNPALAAVAAGSPLLSPAAMLANPSAFYTMPEYYRSQGALQNDQNARESAAAISNAVAVQAQLMTAGQVNQQQTPVFTIGNLPQLQPLVQQHNMFPVAKTQHTIIPYGAVMPPPGQVSNQVAQTIASESNENDGTAGEMLSCGGKGRRKKDMTPVERANQNRERNREHAKSTRLRKKAYVQKLKELVEGLHAERTEEVRQRRVAIQHMAEMQNVRRAVIRSFLRFHSNYERDKRKWETILEDSFWLKQPVTPYRCFRRSEIEQVSAKLAQRNALLKK
jgi:hypothetical protein